VIDLFRLTWVEWALSNQRNLAQDEPINTVMHLGTHNSFNTRSDGHSLNFPNHFFSMTDALRSGARALSLDTHFMPEGVGPARLCHGGDFEVKGNPGVACVISCTPAITGVFPPGMRYYANGVKEIRNWLQANKTEILLVDIENYVLEQGGNRADIVQPLTEYLGSLIYRPPLPISSLGTRWPTRREMLASGRRVIMIDQAESNEVAFKESALVGAFQPSWFAKNLPSFPNCAVPGSPTQFSVVMEDRSGLEVFLDDPPGHLEASDVARAADCNTSFIFMDYFSSASHLPALNAIADFSRQQAAVWSWRVNDVGQNGNCAVLDAQTGRWESGDCQRQEAFACAKPRSESGLDPLEWQDPRGEDWKVTAASGPWTNGDLVCQAEFPGYVFSVPVNGYQNRKLKEANSAGRDIWLNYNQRAVKGRWVIGRRSIVNSPPVADAGPDQVVQCRATVTLDGSRSVDPDGDTLSYVWTGPFGTLTGATVTVKLELGVHDITLTLNDGKGGIDTDSVLVNVRDTTAPSIELSLSPSEIWPPNKQMVDIVAQVGATDSCDVEAPLVTLLSIESNEPERRNDPDIQGAEIGTDDREFQFRADRLGSEIGRIYRVKYRTTDVSGNAAEVTGDVVVPHDMRPTPQDKTEAVPSDSSHGEGGIGPSQNANGQGLENKLKPQDSPGRDQKQDGQETSPRGNANGQKEPQNRGNDKK
jgi:hypothetical protein